ncbi:hypothetical protein N7462_007849 [Penicillium macrosclerotiorum]|uniref:uncharacterized protein n=1 Tax=Penicillium macrosclerotiorum TaxID=303699 RepID=UPI0025484B8B|nr:uncharacterized protein N7462_007849 [Penicillium macrosclerotiorum]KAJ5679605.1 hypothetical protein N7462_007849 [Penicillium macrosclerotiorum]
MLLRLELQEFDFTINLGVILRFSEEKLTMFATRSIGQRALAIPRWTQIRPVSTLEGNPHIYVFPNHGISGSHILSLLPSEPVNPNLAIGVSSKLPPTPDSLTENAKFLDILQDVFAKHAHEDPEAQSQAQVMISTSGANLYSGGVLMTAQQRGKKRRTDISGASGQGGVGSAGRGGWIHISDNRRPPDFGRIAWPEDIFGSLEVDGNGQFVGGDGRYSPSGKISLPTPLCNSVIKVDLILKQAHTDWLLGMECILGLSPFLRDKLVKRLRELEKQG